MAACGRTADRKVMVLRIYHCESEVYYSGAAPFALLIHVSSSNGGSEANASKRTYCHQQ
jgi:hypothetical protein